MAHFAELGLDNIVLRVIVVHSDDCKDQFGKESEIIGAKFCNSLFGGTWVQTSYNGTIRKNFAGAGYSYSSSLDAFIPSKPFLSWVLNSDCIWEAPIKVPEENAGYLWDEQAQNWVKAE
jgi:hypothetical protein